MSINVSDMAFVAGPIPKDPIGGFDMGEATILHEFSHAFSFGNDALLEEFERLVGWQQKGNQWYLTDVDMSEVSRVVSQMQDLMAKGKFAEGIKLNREYGIRHGFPTAYSMINPSESFAEISSHVYFDPNASSYLKPEIITWFQRNVLH